MSLDQHNFTDGSSCVDRMVNNTDYMFPDWTDRNLSLLHCLKPTTDQFDQLVQSGQSLSLGSYLPDLDLIDPSAIKDRVVQGAGDALDAVLDSGLVYDPTDRHEKKIFDAGKDAYAKFPILKEIGASNDILSRIGLYEYRNRSTSDWFQDRLLNLPESRVPEGTYGPYQISKAAFKDAKEHYPDVLKDYHLEDLLDPEKAAVVAGAYLSIRAEEFKANSFRGQDTVRHFYRKGDSDRALVLSYNPGQAKCRGNGNYDGRQRSNDVLDETLQS